MSNPTDHEFTQRLRDSRYGVTLAALTILLGFSLGGVFGAFENSLKSDLTERAKAAPAEVYGGDAVRMKAVTDKSFNYYKRSHLHGGAIGAAALGLMLLLALLRRPNAMVRQACSLALGVGGFGYSLFWMLAARAAPSLGSTDAAKESLGWLAIPSAGLLLLGLTAVLVLTVLELFAPPSSQPANAA
jgi:hypothetical protein